MTLSSPAIRTGDDAALLSAFKATRSGDAFRQLVDRHLPAVHAAATRILRRMNLVQHADDIAQSVFILLAQNAAKIPPGTPLVGWLYKVTHYACANLQRIERNRQKHEQETAAMRPTTTVIPTVSDAEALLDPAIQSLSRLDRDALLLRYTQNLSLAEIARQTRVPEETAKKRLQRALTKLRQYFAAQGMLSAAPLALHAMSPVASPALSPLASAISTAALAPAATASTATAVLIVKGVAFMMKVQSSAKMIAAVIALLLLLIAGVETSNLLKRPPVSSERPTAIAGADSSGQITHEYDIRYLIGDTWQNISPTENLINAIESTVAPDSWRANGGKGELRVSGDGRLTVVQSSKNMLAVNSLLAQFFSIRALAINLECRVILVPNNFLDRINAVWLRVPLTEADNSQSSAAAVVVDNDLVLSATQADERTITVTAPRVMTPNRYPTRIDVDLTKSDATPNRPAKAISIPDLASIQIQLSAGASSDRHNVVLSIFDIKKSNASPSPATRPALSPSDVENLPSTVFSVPDTRSTLFIDCGSVKANAAEPTPSMHLLVVVRPTIQLDDGNGATNILFKAAGGMP